MACPYRVDSERQERKSGRLRQRRLREGAGQGRVSRLWQAVRAKQAKEGKKDRLKACSAAAVTSGVAALPEEKH